MTRSDNDDLLIECDSLLSLIRHRESGGLSELTIRDLDRLLGPLRRATNQIIDSRDPADMGPRG